MMIIRSELELEEFLKVQQKSIIFTNGCFDVLHIGHLRYLKASKALMEYADLVVGLNSDASIKQLKGEGRPINPEHERAELLEALKPVDHVIIFHEKTASNLLSKLKPKIYTKGGDYDLTDYEKCPEFKVAKEINCKVELINFESGYSSSKIISLMEKS